jgi:uncharacterized protein with HEPN domain
MGGPPPWIDGNRPRAGAPRSGWPIGTRAFSADRKTLDAVLYNLAVIGEAANSLASSIGEQYPQLPWAEMRGMRNIVVHEYFGVSPQILWETTVSDLPALEQRLLDLLKAGGFDPLS